MSIPTVRPSFDVGVVVPLPEEFRYMADQVVVRRSISYEGAFFYELELGQTEAVCCLVGRMGTVAASQAAMRLLHWADVKLLVLIGIAGSLQPDVAIGDVVVADEINEFAASSKAVPAGNGYRVRYSGRRWVLPFALRQAVANFEFARPMAYARWLAQAAADYDALTVPGKETVCGPRPTVHIGPIASGNVVVASNAFVEEVKAIDRKFAAIEMEAAGVAAAADEKLHPIQCLVIRGISDSADERKGSLDQQDSGAWRRYSVRNAAGLLRALLEWEGFTTAAGFHRPAGSDEDQRIAAALVQHLQPCPGGPWIVGIAFGFYKHAPLVSQAGVEVVDLSRLRVTSARAGELIAVAERMTEDLRKGADVTSAIRGFERLVDEYRRYLGSPRNQEVLQQLDDVVTRIVLPADGQDGLAASLLFQATQLEETIGPEAVLEFLQPSVPEDRRLRERYVDAAVKLQDWHRAVETFEQVALTDASRLELEHLAVAYLRSERPADAARAFILHRDRYRDKGGQLVRTHLLKDYPSLSELVGEVD